MKAFKLDVKRIMDVVVGTDSDDLDALLEETPLEDPESLSEFFTIVAIADETEGTFSNIRGKLIDFVSGKIDFVKFASRCILLECGCEPEDGYDLSPELMKALSDEQYSRDIEREINELTGWDARHVVEYVFYELDEFNNAYIPALVRLIFDQWCIDYDTLFRYVSMCIKDQPENS